MWLFCAHIAVAATDTMSTSDDALIGAVAATVARDDAVIDALFRGSGRNRSPCQHVYLDVGSNIGVQLRKLYEPRLYPHAQVLPIFDRLFGTDSGSRCGVCALGFEPNPHHAARLARLQVHLTHRLGVRAHVFRAAAGTADSVATFAMPSKHGASGKTDGSADWAASTNAPYRGMDRRAGYLKYQSTTSVRVLDLSRIIRRVARLLRPTSSTSSTQQHPGSGSRSPHPQDQVAQAATRPKLFMKLDCEGCEMELLHHLVFTQALCSIDEMYIEWHDKLFAPQYLRLNAKKQGIGADAAGGAQMWRLLRSVHSFVFDGLATNATSNTSTLPRGRPFRGSNGSMVSAAANLMHADTGADCLLRAIHTQDDETYLHDPVPMGQAGTVQVCGAYAVRPTPRLSRDPLDAHAAVQL